jgi:hypothetical protein
MGARQPHAIIENARRTGRAPVPGLGGTLVHPPVKPDAPDSYWLMDSDGALMVAFAPFSPRLSRSEPMEMPLIIRVAAPRGLRYERLSEEQAERRCRVCHSAEAPALPDGRDLWGDE